MGHGVRGGHLVQPAGGSFGDHRGRASVLSPAQSGACPVPDTLAVRPISAYTKIMRFYATEPKRSANIAKHGFDPADFEDAFSFDRYLTIPTKPSRTGRERLKLSALGTA